MPAAGLPRWWSQDQAVLDQPAVKAKSYNEGAERAEPIDSSVPSNWWRRESGVHPQQLAAAAAMLQNTAEPPTPTMLTDAATPGLPTWYRRQSSALLDINAATKTASAHVTPTTSPTLPNQSVATESAASPALPSQSVTTESAASPALPSQSVATESAAPALSPVERLKEWQKFAKDSLSDFYCVGPRPNKSYGCLQSRRAIVR